MSIADFGSKQPPPKVHNSTTGPKVELRDLVLAEVQPARIFDAFCGPEGEMWRGVWHKAAHYLGVDEELRFPDPRRRFVGDSRLVMRAIDLAPFNVFDFDAFGSPWEWMVLLAARRRWLPGERGAVVLTDGSGFKTAMGFVSAAVSDLTGFVAGHGLVPKAETAEALNELALQSWVARSRVRLLHRWEMRSRGSQEAKGETGGFPMVYSALVFEGLPQ